MIILCILQTNIIIQALQWSSGMCSSPQGKISLKTNFILRFFISFNFLVIVQTNTQPPRVFSVLLTHVCKQNKHDSGQTTILYQYTHTYTLCHSETGRLCWRVSWRSTTFPSSGRRRGTAPPRSLSSSSSQAASGHTDQTTLTKNSKIFYWGFSNICLQICTIVRTEFGCMVEGLPRRVSNSCTFIPLRHP